MTARRGLRAPFPWFGGKSRAADLVWRAFGNVPNYVEPFAGSLAVLLARPHAGKVETANDLDGFVANFWRALQHDPTAVATAADWPVNEVDLTARHAWLVQQRPDLRDRMLLDPEYYDPKIAGWWVWGISAWIGNGWCHSDDRLASPAGAAPRRQLPMIGTPGNGIHSPSRKKPLTHRNKGVHRSGAPPIHDLFAELQARLRGVRICSGEWHRVLGRSTLGIDTRHGMTPCGVMLDPPYQHSTREKRLYHHDDAGISDRVRAWALEHGDNPDLRIALCGQEGEHDMPPTWTCHAWRSTSSARSRDLERIWLSPHCLPVGEQGWLTGVAS